MCCDVMRYDVIDVMWCDIWYDMNHMIWYEMIYDVMWCDVIDVMWCDVMSCHVIWYMIWYDMIWYDMIWYDRMIMKLKTLLLVWRCLYFLWLALLALGSSNSYGLSLIWTWISNYIHYRVWNVINYLTPKLRWYNNCNLGMDKYVHPTLYWACDYLSMLVVEAVC